MDMQPDSLIVLLTAINNRLIALEQRLDDMDSWHQEHDVTIKEVRSKVVEIEDKLAIDS